MMRWLSTIIVTLCLMASPCAAQLVDQVWEGQIYIDGVLVNGGGGSTNSASWGNIGGYMPNQTDLWYQLTNRYTRAEIDAFGFLTVETDPIFLNWGNTNTYVKAEVDPIWAAVSNTYGRLTDDQTWTGTNLFRGYVVIGTADKSLLGIVTTRNGYTSTNVLVVNGNIVPFDPDASLGTAANPWESLYILNNSIFMGTNKVGISDSGTLIVYSVDTNGVIVGSNEVAYVDSAAQGTSTNLSDYNNDVPFLIGETDPIWAAVSNLYAKTNWVISLGYLTVETDPIWAAVSNSYAKTNWVTGLPVSTFNNDAGYLRINDSPEMAASTVWNFWTATRNTNRESAYIFDEYVTYGKVYNMLELYSQNVLFISSNAHPVVTGADTLVEERPTEPYIATLPLPVGTTYDTPYLITNAVTEVVPQGMYILQFYSSYSQTGNPLIQALFDVILTDGTTTNIITSSSSTPLDEDLGANYLSAFNASPYTIPPGGPWYVGVQARFVRTGGSSATLKIYGGTDEFNSGVIFPSLGGQGTVWGQIEGQLASQDDLWPYLDWVAANSNNVCNSTTNMTDGLSLHKQALYITNVAGTVYCETELIGGGDMTYMFGASFYTLDCTTGGGIGGRARSGALTTGSDTNPVLNYIYVVPGAGTAAVLTNATVMPTGQFAWMARCYLQSPATTQTAGPLALQRTTEAVAHDGRGAIAYDRERMRQEPASYFSGVDFTVTDDAAGNITWASAAGIVYQMHRQVFPSFTDPAEIVVINDPTTPYRVITNFNQILETATGVAIANNRSFGLHVFGNAASGDDGVSRLYITLPLGTYGANLDALSDAQNYDVNYLPQGLRGGGFSIARVVLRKSSGTYELVAGGDQDFRGFAINATSGGGAGSGNSQVSFQDSVFNIYGADPTKRIFFSAAQLTTGTDRTYTMPDTNGTVQLVDYNEGVVKINAQAGGTDPSYSLTDGVDQQITYITPPVMDSTSSYPENGPTNWTAMYYTNGVNTNIFLENQVLGQVQFWRMDVSWSNKNINTSAGLSWIIENPLSGFRRTMQITLPTGIGEGRTTFPVVFTYTDANSAAPPLGTGLGGYEFYLRADDDDIDVTINDITRHSTQHN